MVEYALLLALIAMTAMVAVRTTGVRVSESLGNASATIAAPEAGTTGGGATQGSGNSHGRGNGNGHGNGH